MKIVISPAVTTLALLACVGISSAGPQASGTAAQKAAPAATSPKTASPPVSSITGKTYVDEEENTIAFHAQGKATETNGRVGTMYARQSAVFGNNGRAVSECTYSQTGSKVNLSCEAAEEMKLVYTLNKDGSLTGPPEGMYGHASFAHLTEKGKTTAAPVAATASTSSSRSPTKEHKDALQAAAAKSLEMVLVPSGEFIMGSSEDEKGHQSDEVAHSVRITRAFEIGKYEVTQGLWESVMGNNPSQYGKCGPNCPVESVSWEEVQAFLRGLNRKYVGRGYRLPTEAEWEFAARAGNRVARYGALGAIAWYEDNSNDTTHPVGLKQPNGFGIFDMFGNVWEYCSDWYGPYPTASVADPTGPASGSERVFRGGSYSDTTGREGYRVLEKGRDEQRYYPEGRSLRAAFRQSNDTKSQNVGGGFRLARSVTSAH